MLVGALALSGVPPFNGFWSKDSILHALYAENMVELLVVLSITAIMTVFYTFRMIGLAFYGAESEHVKHLIEEGHEPHDPGMYMSISLWVLAIGAIVSGFILPNVAYLFIPGFEYLGIEHEVFKELIIFKYKFYLYTVSSPTFLLSLLIVGVGLYPAWGVYIRSRWDPVQIIERSSLLRGIWKFLYNRWYINTLYYRVFVNGTVALANVTFRFIEANGSGDIIKAGYIKFSNGVRRLQTGYLRVNMAYILLGLLLFLLVIYLFV
jgi:NADH:ubiquinone oxidoreductase subunit 5 (subunit L)/multisubunit Na+/H+ antiporter MnhA subunit